MYINLELGACKYDSNLVCMEWIKWKDNKEVYSLLLRRKSGTQRIIGTCDVRELEGQIVEHLHSQIIQNQCKSD
jgi:hypothetical protein